METKLSRLQKQIILLALEKNQSLGEPEIIKLGDIERSIQGPDLFYGEIYSEIFGLSPDFKHPDGNRMGRPKFTKADKSKLNAARTSTSRTLSRLRKRDLIESCGIRINLTPKGKECAQRLRE